MQGTIVKVSGPLIVASGMADVQMFDVVRVSKQQLIGEIIELRGDRASIQVYEETGGIGPGEPVFTTGAPLSVELGPGLIESIYDGIQRPLTKIREQAGDRIPRGVMVDALDHEKLWGFTPVAKVGDELTGGDVLGTVQETEIVTHKIMVPPGVSGKLTWIFEGEANIVTPIAKLEKDGKEIELPMLQRWPVRRGRPYKEKLPPTEPMVTGQRVIDTLFPVAKGGVAAVPGPFGSGKTVVQHQLAKWSDADIIVYVGCGERGNEMTDVLMEFPELKDPKTGLSLMKRTILIANTSDMPVAAREASIYTGITIAEYFRDMGYKVAIMADSTSRWAEALREMSGRLEEMSPPGGDISEPVSQATLRIVKVYWGLSSKLAYARHFPAIDWLQSYSLYLDRLEGWFNENVAPDWSGMVQKTMNILQEESELDEIVRLVGIDALSHKDRLTMEAARSIREDYLHQNAFHEVDTYTSPQKQALMLKTILGYYEKANEALNADAPFHKLIALPVREKIGRLKYVTEAEAPAAYEQIMQEMGDEIGALVEGGLN